MTGTKAGGLKCAASNKKKYGDDYYHRIGKRGGSVSTPTGGFGSDKVGSDGLTGRERAKVAGRKGGIISKRGPAKNMQEEG